MGEVRFRLLGPMEMSVDGEAGQASRVRRTRPAGPAAPRPRPHHPGHHAGRPALVGVHAAGRPDERAADPGLQAAPGARGRSGVDDLVDREGVGYRAASTRPRSTPCDFARPASGRRAPTGAEAAGGGGFQPRHSCGAYDDALALWRGEPLSDFVTEQWATAEAARLTELRHGRPHRTRPDRSGARPASRGRRATWSRSWPRTRPWSPLAGSADGGSLPQRPPGRRAGGLRPHPRRPRRVARAGAFGLAAVAAGAGAAPGRVARRRSPTWPPPAPVAGAPPARRLRGTEAVPACHRTSRPSSGR